MNNEEIIKHEILKGLQQVDSTFSIIEFSTVLDDTTRKLLITFTAQNSSGEKISEVVSYA